MFKLREVLNNALQFLLVWNKKDNSEKSTNVFKTNLPNPKTKQQNMWVNTQDHLLCDETNGMLILFCFLKVIFKNENAHFS